VCCIVIGVTFGFLCSGTNSGYPVDWTLQPLAC
jgi:hypothetical protein